MTNFELALAFTLGTEGAWSADPNDKDNWTGGRVLAGELMGRKYGLSAANYPDLDMQSLTLEQAEEIYRTDVWLQIQGDALPPLVAMVVFDCAVVHGVGAAIRLLQKVVGVPGDGVIGPKTISAVQLIPETEAVIELNARRAVMYATLPTFDGNALCQMRRLFQLTATALRG